MGVQQHRRSKSRNRRRRAEILKLENPSIVTCPKCHELKQPHRICPACGYYDGRKILEVNKKKKAE